MKKIKMWIELLFIFLLPLIFMSLSVKIETTKEYDENNNEISKLNNFTWEYPYNDFKNEKHYINYLKYNQQVNNINFSITTSALEIRGVNLVTNHKYLCYSDYSRVSNGNVIDYQTFLRYRGTTIFYAFNDNNYYIYQPLNDGILYLGAQTYNNFAGEVTGHFNVIDLTLMFGNGYEPTITEFQNYNIINLPTEYIQEQEVIYYTENTNISENWKYNYSVWGTIYNDIIIKNLYLTDNITTRFILTYTITWFIMFILWHTIYVPFDWLIHLVTPKQKE